MFEAFQFGPFLVWTRLLFLLLGTWLATEFFLRIAQTANLSLNHFRERSLWYIGAFFLSGRLLAILSEYKVYLKDPFRMLLFWDGGFSFLGGAIGIGIILAIATKGHRSTFLHWLDALVPAVTLGLVFAWLGSFFSGNSYGRPTDMPWGVIFDAPQVRYAVPLHPVQLYYALFFFCLTFVLLIIRKRAKRVGSETLIGIICASLATFFFEYYRGDFSIPVFATQLDFMLLAALFLSLIMLGFVENKLSTKGFFGYELTVLLLAGGFLLARPFLELDTYELRFSQLLAVLTLLGTVVYVVQQRRRYPHL